ncbi:MAG: DedA family protein [Thaumarchaeota archaeon]|nr:DedA family protein [Nitrososphaerota archaeon]
MRLRSLNSRSRYALVGAALFVVTISVLFSDSIEDLVTGANFGTSTGVVQNVTGALTSVVISAINGTGYLGIFGLMLLEATSLPVPSEVILPFAGYLVSIGRLGYWETVGLATLAGVIGALIDYYIGLFLGTKVISNYGSRFFIGREQMMKVESLFQRHGGQIAFFSRLVPGVRTLASFPAGSARMNLPRFTLYTALGCFVFDAVLVYAGDYFGAHWSVIRSIGILEIGVTVAVIVAAGWVFLRMQKRSQEQPPAPESS